MKTAEQFHDELRLNSADAIAEIGAALIHARTAAENAASGEWDEAAAALRSAQDIIGDMEQLCTRAEKEAR